MNSENRTETISAAAVATECITLDVLASQFVDEHRRWLNPSIEAYALTYPEYADEIRESFPVLIAMEQWKGNQEFSSLRRQLPEPDSIKQLGDCRITRELSRNRTSILYEAVQGKWNRRVLVKLLPWKSEMTPRWRERFEREARLVARLRHPNIVSFYKSGEDQGYCFSVTQQVDGVGLDQIIEYFAGESQFSQKNIGKQKHRDQIAAIAHSLQENRWRALTGIALQVADALRYAHSRETLHNDLKPENILIDAAGHVWVNNFSLAQFAEGALKQQPAKTLCYQAPERFQGQNHEQGDIYSLGMVLYELATLSPAFPSSNSSELVEQILNQEPLRPRAQNPSIPVNFESMILNCIAKSQQQRYQSVEALSIDLVRLIHGKSVKRRTSSLGVFNRIRFPFWNHNLSQQSE
ncbi:Serine/threonine-protein kinase PknB [Gimesia alba]|uniref:Serine/threonine-protein kinase PknB n=1 Tax=Gimesia alba TaxID=2527973 RepID=A0A517RCM8_9PLAN|nr:serine/threonine-protein kinase [Gimesia alba]QDT41640.1 Serine/threonine-protein kinase PknB [Gimesia alba]